MGTRNVREMPSGVGNGTGVGVFVGVGEAVGEAVGGATVGVGDGGGVAVGRAVAVGLGVSVSVPMGVGEGATTVGDMEGAATGALAEGARATHAPIVTARPTAPKRGIGQRPAHRCHTVRTSIHTPIGMIRNAPPCVKRGAGTCCGFHSHHSEGQGKARA